ncbi:MAG: DUF998 domain-containing protein [Candidatus Lokiarchaeota archaeon]|nr:DUF998 domain-containing protein [Candidatus Lokiarchaeota archaeon]
MGIIEFKNKIYESLTDFKNVKTCLYLVLGLYLSLLLVGVILAIFTAPDGQGYTIWTQWISDLGSYRHTGFPFLYDIACGVAGVLTIPFTFYLEKVLSPEGSSSRMRFRLASFGWFVGLIGSVGYVFVGIFSEDRAFEIAALGTDLHMLFSGVAFGGFTLSAICFGLLILFYDTKFPKGLGVYGIFGPAIVMILNVLGTPLLEWMLLFSILAWIIPLSLILIHHGPD